MILCRFMMEKLKCDIYIFDCKKWFWFSIIWLYYECARFNETDALFFATEILTQFLVFDEKWIDDADNSNIQTLFCHYLTVERVVCIFCIKGILFGWELFPHANVQGLVFLYRVQTPWLGSGQVGSAIYGLG